METAAELPKAAPRPRPYAAFISYSRAADGKLAPALQRGLQRFAKPWYRLRALRVFRDDASLSANPDLWGSIRDALDGSAFFVLLASPESAASPWVEKEVQYWVEHRGTEQLLIVLTDGELLWDGSSVDWSTTTALPGVLGEVFDEEPRYVDLRWARESAQLAPRDARFRSAVADLAAPLHGRSKDDLLGEDVRQHRRALRLAWSAGVLLALLAIGASTAAALAVKARDSARTEARTALSRQLAAEATAQLDGPTAVAPLLALEAYRRVSSDPFGRGYDARDALARALERSPRLVATLPQDGVTAFAFSPDGRTAATGGAKGTIRFWSRTGEPLSPPLGGRAPANVRSVAFSPDGRLLAVRGATGALAVWDVRRRRPLGPPLERPVDDPAEPTWQLGSLAFSRDGALLATGDADGRVVLWDVRSGRVRRTLSAPTFNHLDHVAFGAGGRTVLSTVTTDDFNPRTTVRDVRTGGVVRTVLQGSFPPVAFSDDGTRFVSIADGFRVAGTLDRDPGRRLPLRLPGTVAAVSDDGETAVALEYQKAVGSTLVVWDVRRRARLAELPLYEDADSLRLSGDGRMLASVSSDGAARLWDIGADPPLAKTLRVGAAGGPVAVAPDGATVAFQSGPAVVLRDARGGRLRSKLPVGAGYVSAIGFSPDGRTVAVGGGGGRVTLWTPGGRRVGALRLRTARDPAITAVSFSADGDRLTATNADGTMQAFDVATGRPVGPQSSVSVPTCRTTGVLVGKFANCSETVARTPDGRIAAVVGGSAQIPLWDAVRERALGKLRTGGFGSVAAFSPDGRLLAAAGSHDVSLWSVARGQPFGGALSVESGQVGTVAFSTRGDRLVTSGTDGTIRLWDPLLLSTDYESWRARLCAVAGRSLTRDEWSEFMPGQPYRETCAGAVPGQ